MGALKAARSSARLSHHSRLGHHGSTGGKAAAGRRQVHPDGRRIGQHGRHHRRVGDGPQVDHSDQRPGLRPHAGESGLRGDRADSLRRGRCAAERAEHRRGDQSGAGRSHTGQVRALGRLPHHRPLPELGEGILQDDDPGLQSRGENTCRPLSASGRDESTSAGEHLPSRNTIPRRSSSANGPRFSLGISSLPGRRDGNRKTGAFRQHARLQVRHQRDAPTPSTACPTSTGPTPAAPWRR